MEWGEEALLGYDRPDQSCFRGLSSRSTKSDGIERLNHRPQGGRDRNIEPRVLGDNILSGELCRDLRNHVVGVCLLRMAIRSKGDQRTGPRHCP